MDEMSTSRILKTLKRRVLGASRSCGLFSLSMGSEWRRRRLLILSYHGISLQDEHEWNPKSFMSPQDFERRMTLLARHKCHVLPLHEGIKLLYSNRLPERSVALTFDDGNYDFYRQAWPILQKHRIAATVYLTTFYKERPMPVWPQICSYMLWKQRLHTADFTGLPGLQGPVMLHTSEARADLVDILDREAIRQGLTAEDKNKVASKLADRIGLDYGALTAQRILQIMTSAEVADIASHGVDIQLHTHRHRTPLDAGLFRREISDNRHAIEQITNAPALHFCYPNGHYQPEFIPWLSSEGVASATTCDAGLASPSSPSLLLPRLVDHSGLSDVEFEGWLCGVSAVLPRRDKVQQHSLRHAGRVTAPPSGPTTVKTTAFEFAERLVGSVRES